MAQTWKASSESLKDKLTEIERKYIKRYNKLMEDHNKEEQRLLRNLKAALEKEFVVDCWEEAIAIDPEQDVLALYYNYEKIAYEKISKELQLEKDSKLPL